MQSIFISQPLRITTLGILLLLGGCATFSNDGGFNNVQSLTKERTGHDVTWIRSESDGQAVTATVKELLQQPLTAETAITIALLNNKGLQANYAELGISEADLVQAGRIRNPTLTFSRLTRGSEIEYERTFTLPILHLFIMPITTKIETRRFEQTQMRAASSALRIVDETRRAYYAAISASETITYMEQVNDAAQAGAELARRMAQAGNWSTLRQAQEQSFYAEATTQLARAQQSYVSQREKLTRLMGLWGGDRQFQLPARLPDLPKAPKEVVDAEAQALTNRLDILMTQRELAGLADSLGLTRKTRFVNLLDVGYLNNTSNEQPRQTGYQIELQIPLFDWGSARVVKAESIYMQAVNRAAEIAVNARSEVRENYTAYRTAYDIAKHYRDEIVPLKKRITDESVLRYNGMLISVFDLLAGARSQAMTVNASIEALRDYWMADSALQMALTGTSASIVVLSRTNNSKTTEPVGH